MKGSIRVSAKTLDDAITEALIQLGVTSDRLEYNVIEKGSAGFLGIGMKQAVIEAWKKEDKEEDKNEEDKNDNNKDDEKKDEAEEDTKKDPMAEEARKAIEKAYEEIQKLAIEELKEESKYII